MIIITDTITIANITIAIITMDIITISPGPKFTQIRLQSVGSGHQIPLENLCRRSALPKIQLSTSPAQSNAAIVNTMAVRHREISSRWAH
jgi:hypothetical protein